MKKLILFFCLLALGVNGQRILVVPQTTLDLATGSSKTFSLIVYQQTIVAKPKYYVNGIVNWAMIGTISGVWLDKSQTTDIYAVITKNFSQGAYASINWEKKITSSNAWWFVGIGRPLTTNSHFEVTTGIIIPFSLKKK